MRRTEPRTGVLLTNVGSPTAPTTAEVRRYLREFLADPLVIDAPRLRWWLIRNLFILPFRAPRSAGLYRSIWTEDGSPLVATTRRQAAALFDELNKRSARPGPVVPAMRYGEPSIRNGLRELADSGCGAVVVLPLYPQYSRTTVETTRREVERVRAGIDSEMKIRHLAGYHDHLPYIRSLAASIRSLNRAGARGSHLVMSFHGLPQRYVDEGDPYRDQCEVTAGLLADELGLDRRRWTLCYQSRFGRERWLEPSTESTMVELAGNGSESIDVICPGFAADCLETLEEIAVAGRKLYEKSGGSGFRYVPALNDRPDHISALADLVEPLLGGGG